MYLIEAYIIDWWTLGHVALFAGYGYLLYRMYGPKLSAFVIGLAGLTLGIDWEIFELWIAEPLLNFHEPFWNRWGADLIADVVGTLAGRYAAKVSL